MKTRLIRSLLALICVFALPLSATAQETSGSFATGSVKVGNDTRSCSASLEGAIRYNTTSDSIEYCDGSGWVNVTTGGAGGSGACTIGAAYGDGICAGVWQGENLIAAPAGCNNGDTVASDCDGIDDTETWGLNSWGDQDNSYIDMVQANADYFTEYGSTPSNKAAGSCNGLGLDGATWYLPTLGQLAVLYENRNTGSWTGGGFSNDLYWSVNIRGFNNAIVIDFAGGSQMEDNSDFSSQSFRCVRTVPF